MNILQINTCDIEGGAAKVAYDLFKGYQVRGEGSWLAVGFKQTSDQCVFEIPRNHPPYLPWASATWGLYTLLKKYEGRIRGAHRARRWSYSLSDVWAEIERQLGREDFNFRGSKNLLSLPPVIPDIVHAHNLHGNFFDLRYLPLLSKKMPVIITLHDAWLLSGHCAHSLGCERWRTGCGFCPDLKIPPAVVRDVTKYNWEIKRKIFTQSRLFITTPSQWLMDKIGASILAPAVLRSLVIPNGVDLKVFHPVDRNTARRILGIPQDARVLIFVANGVTNNVFKDFNTLKIAVSKVYKDFEGEDVRFIALGEAATTNTLDSVPVDFVGFKSDPKEVSIYYQAADIYIHAAHADTFPNTILEAMACGTPVVATGVGGIPEQLIDGKTGFLVPPENPAAMASRISNLLFDEKLRDRMGKNAAEWVRRNFDLNRQIEQTLTFYQEAQEIFFRNEATND